MGSVISEIKCLNCGYEHAFTDYYYKSGEEYTFCGRCGSSFSWFINNRPKGNYPKNWKPEFKEEKDITNHAFRYGDKTGVNNCGGFRTKRLKDFKKDMKTAINEKKITKAEYTFKRKGKWFVRDLIKQKTKKFSRH